VNSRLDSLQAAVLNCRLPLLDDDNARRRAIAAIYRDAFRGVGDLRLPPDAAEVEPVYHQMTVRTARRDELMEHLKARGIASAVHYPSTLDRQPAFEGSGLAIGAGGDLPASTAAAREVLCLPIFPELTDGEAHRVCDAVRSFYGGA
jgi:dTDP-4-amino-4,6-dideoxygalactose transaminase